MLSKDHSRTRTYAQVPCKYHHVGSGCKKTQPPCPFKHSALDEQEKEWVLLQPNPLNFPYEIVSLKRLLFPASSLLNVVCTCKRPETQCHFRHIHEAGCAAVGAGLQGARGALGQSSKDRARGAGAHRCRRGSACRIVGARDGRGCSSRAI